MEVSAFQEEADGRLLLHAKHAANEGYHAVVICSFRSVAQKPGGKSLTSVKLLPLLAWEYAGLVSACMHSLDVIPSVPLRAEGKPKALKLLVSNVENQDMFFKSRVGPFSGTHG